MGVRLASNERCMADRFPSQRGAGAPYLVTMAGVRDFGSPLLLSFLLLLSHDGAALVKPAPVRLTPWAWERNEDLRFLERTKDKPTPTVAFLACTLRAAANDIEIVRRHQPIRFPERVKLIAVVRIETDRRRGASLDSAQRKALIDEIVPLTALDRVEELQIDFDARQSERARYADLLRELRARIPLRTRLSITALASWCTSDRWCAGRSARPFRGSGMDARHHSRTTRFRPCAHLAGDRGVP